MLLPFLELLSENSGKARTEQLYDRVAQTLQIDSEDREAKVKSGNRWIKEFNRKVRFSQQEAKRLGLARPVGNTLWEITDKGKATLTKAEPEIIVTVFTTKNGIALWACAESALTLVEDKSIDLVFTSPPYPIAGRPKAYRNDPEQKYVDSLLKTVEQFPRKLKDSGSLVINLGDVWLAGRPELSLYQERLLLALHEKLGLHLLQRFVWHNPCRLPSPLPWTCIQRIRVKINAEFLYWLSPNPHCYTNQKAVLQPYAESSLREARNGGVRAASRPSGHKIGSNTFSLSHGGSIPGTVITAANSDSNSRFLRECKAKNLPIHPARMPLELAKFFISFLTPPSEDSVILDPFAGSLLTGFAAHQLQRRFILIEKYREYIEGGALRFNPNEIEYHKEGIEA